MLALAITETMVGPIETAINSGLETLLPIGIGIMATMLGVSLIPKIIYRFF